MNMEAYLVKKCPFCGGVAQVNTWTMHGITESRCFCPNSDCPNSVRTVALEQWNTRPIEDALEARISELEEAVGLITTLKPTMVMDTEHPLDMAKEVAEYVTARIAELEADSVQIQYVCEDELPEGISDEVFSAMYACSTVDFVRVYPYITIDGHKRFLIDFPEVQNA